MRVANEPRGGWNRPGMTKEDYWRATQRLEAIYEGRISKTSGVRSPKHNDAVGATGQSHVRGMGDDYLFDYELSQAEEALCYVICKTLGLKAEFHDAGGGRHLHVQAP